MLKKLHLILPVVVILTLVLSACALPASQAPAATPTLAEAFPFPVVTDNPEVMKEIQTQTALAISTAPPTLTSTPETKAVDGSEAAVGGESAASGGDGSSSSAPVVVPTVERPATYTLQKGEWPICIARRFNLDLNTFFTTNGLSMASKPAVGARLTIPSSGTWNSSAWGSRALHSHPTSYTVKSGDTIYTVACYFGDVAPEQIAAANGLSSPYTITAGQTLQIP